MGNNPYGCGSVLFRFYQTQGFCSVRVLCTLFAVTKKIAKTYDSKVWHYRWSRAQQTAFRWPGRLRMIRTRAQLNVSAAC